MQIRKLRTDGVQLVVVWLLAYVDRRQLGSSSIEGRHLGLSNLTLIEALSDRSLLFDVSCSLILPLHQLLIYLLMLLEFRSQLCLVIVLLQSKLSPIFLKLLFKLHFFFTLFHLFPCLHPLIPFHLF